MTSLEVTGAIHATGIIPWNGFATADDHYAIPEEHWVETDFLSLLRAFQHSVKQERYIAESNDCDDFAKMAAAFARLVYSNSRDSAGTTIAIGEFYYQRDGGGNHAINLALVHASEGLKLIFLDPQTWQIVHLSETELQSCLNWIL